MKYEKSSKVFVCCGQYIAVTQYNKNRKIYCPRCNKELTDASVSPKVIIIAK